MKALRWSADDLVDFAQIVDVGAAELMRLQEQGWACIAW